jgi:hypothetical protein
MHEGRLRYDDAVDIIDTFLVWGLSAAGDGHLDFDKVIMGLYEDFGPIGVYEIVRAAGAQTVAGALMGRLYGEGDEAG